jgi:hypothetical protein
MGAPAFEPEFYTADSSQVCEPRRVRTFGG